MTDLSGKRVFLAGHRGMVGSAIHRRMQAMGIDPITRTRAELDLVDQAAVRNFMEHERPEVVLIAAAKVGGIDANNTQPAEFIYENLQIEANIIHEAFSVGVHNLLFLGSSCIYPRDADQPMSEDALLTGPLEPTNEPYAVAKIAGIKLCESYNRQYGTDYRSIMPTNLYGPYDNFSDDTSHVIPALIRRFHEAKTAYADSVAVWGTGKVRREFLHVDDLASACLFLLSLPQSELDTATKPMLTHLNVGSGEEVTIAELASLVARVVGYDSKITFDSSKPDGTPRKLLDSGKMKRLGWQPTIGLEKGLEETYAWYLANRAPR